MTNRKDPFVVGEYYHLYNRGNSKQSIFNDIADRVRFQQLLYLSNSEQQFKLEYFRRDKVPVFSVDRGDPIVAIAAYCLMPNHFHLLITPLTDDGVSQFMRKVATGYVMYFNKRYDRTGGLFEGRFKSKWANNDQYLRYLYAYIHLNPQKLFDQRDVEDNFDALVSYRFSSLQDHLNARRRSEAAIIDNLLFPHYHDAHELKRDLLEWIDYEAAEQVRPVQDAENGL